MSHEQVQAPSPDSLRRGYEPASVNHRPLVIFFIVFILTAIVLQTGLWALLKSSVHEKRPVDYPQSAVEFHTPPPPPQLQPMPSHPYVPAQDLAQMREEENHLFAKLGWHADESSGQVTIPQSIVEQLAQQQPKPTVPK